jgi:hypothetical protein
MQTGTSAPLKSLLVAVSLAAATGCDTGANPPADPGFVAEFPEGRYQVDAERGRIWFLTYEGAFVYEPSRTERIAVHLPGWVSAGAPYACPPDLALGPRGEALITSNVTPTVWKVDPRTLAVTVHPLALDADQDKDAGFTALAYSPQHRAFLAASYMPGSLWRIDPGLTKAEKLPLSGPINEACGLTVRPRNSQQTLRPPPDLCVRTPRGGWSVQFAPDWRSAYVSAAPCTARAWPVDAAWLESRR